MAASEERGTAAGRDNRQAIVLAAANEIARNGVRGLRVEEVAAAADVSPALLYYHFESRAGVVRAALEHASEQAPSTALRSAPADRSGYEALEAALLGELSDDEGVRQAAIVWGEVSASAVFDPELRDAVRKVTEEWRAEVADAIRAGIADGSVRDGADPDLAADMLISLVDGLCTRWLAAAIDRDDARKLLREALEQAIRRGE
jgi:AcrR family transcriptional regulator